MTDRIDQTLSALSRDAFRAKFRLTAAEREYVQQKGISTVQVHARDLLTKRLGAANPKNDGRQTPWRGHPVFVAQHATGTCCRSCLCRWHAIKKGKELSDGELSYAVAIIARWIERQLAQCHEPPV